VLAGNGDGSKMESVEVNVTAVLTVSAAGDEPSSKPAPTAATLAAPVLISGSKVTFVRFPA